LIEHILLPGIFESEISLHEKHKKWIDDWLHNVKKDIENGIISSSICIAGFISEQLLYGKNKIDWSDVMSKYLEDNENLLTYSENFGKKLYKFNQWKQTSVHSTYARWWIEKNLNNKIKGIPKIIESFIQDNGWIFNESVSPTNIKTRMRAELFMSLGMGTEILAEENYLKKNKLNLISTATSIPLTGFVSAEYFRFKTLQSLNEESKMVQGIDSSLKKCITTPGFADFAIENKIDDYMGVTKRISRDEAVFSPISTLHALKLAKGIKLVPNEIEEWERGVLKYLEKNPLGIPALKMRDLKPDFGDGVSIYEVISASKLMQK